MEERDLLGFMGGWGFLKVETLWETQLRREVGDLGFRIRDIVFTYLCVFFFFISCLNG